MLNAPRLSNGSNRPSNSVHVHQTGFIDVVGFHLRYITKDIVQPVRQIRLLVRQIFGYDVFRTLISAAPGSRIGMPASRVPITAPDCIGQFG